MAKIYSDVLTLKELFESPDRIVIPRYQRDYAWEKNNVLSLINDIKDNKDFNNKTESIPYFIGNIMGLIKGVLSDSSTKKLSVGEMLIDEEVDIIDGQQRIITLYLIMMYLLVNGAEEFTTSIFEKKGDNKFKLNINERVDPDGSNILALIYDYAKDEKKNISKLNKYREIKMYKVIESELKKYTKSDMSLLIRNIKSVEFVFILFSKNDVLGHQMFVNLNTKSVPLLPTDILKSQLFIYLKDEHYKEEWHNMINSVSKNLADYYRFISLLTYGHTKSTKNAFTLQEFIKEINNKENAIDIFYKFTDSNLNRNIYSIYSMVLKNDFLNIEEYFGITENKEKNSFPMADIKSIWNLYVKIRYTQFNYVLVVLLYYKTEKEKKQIFKNHNIIKELLLFMIMHLVLLSVQGTSPSSVGKLFLMITKDFYENRDIKCLINKLMNNNSFSKQNTDKDYCRKMIKEMIPYGSHINLARTIIMLSDERILENESGEHFFNQSDSDIYNNLLKPNNRKNLNSREDFSEIDKIIYQIGNIIPVEKDFYEDKTPEEKIIKYREHENTEYYIKSFLEFVGDRKDYEKIVKDRTKKITNDFLNKYYKLKGKMKNYSDEFEK